MSSIYCSFLLDFVIFIWRNHHNRFFAQDFVIFSLYSLFRTKYAMLSPSFLFQNNYLADIRSIIGHSETEKFRYTPRSANISDLVYACSHPVLICLISSKSSSDDVNLIISCSKHPKKLAQTCSLSSRSRGLARDLQRLL